MSTYFLASPDAIEKPSTPGRPVLERRKLRLESLDGLQVIPLDGSTGWRAQSGSTGLEMPPVDVATAAVPGVPGSTLQEVRVEERPVFVPVLAQAATAVSHRDMLDAVRQLVDPLRGEFRLVGILAGRERQLTVIYTGGLEGADGRDVAGVYWRKLGITAMATQPFAEARTNRLVEFRQAVTGSAFLGEAGGTDAPWPRALSSSTVIGENMRVTVTSDVPVYPVIELVGPMDSFTGSLSLANPSLPPFYGGREWSVSIPAGVPAGQTFRMVTDPRAKSFRLNGALAAGRVARGSQLRPFYPGENVMNVSAPGSNENTRVRVSWRELHRSLW